MKCSNCSSTEIIDIQGQNYCLNCGLAVPQAVVIQAPIAPSSTQAPAKVTAEINPNSQETTPLPVDEASKPKKVPKINSIPLHSIIPASDIPAPVTAQSNTKPQPQTLPSAIPKSDPKQLKLTQSALIPTKLKRPSRNNESPSVIAKTSSFDVKTPSPVTTKKVSTTNLPAATKRLTSNTSHPARTAATIISHRLWISTFISYAGITSILFYFLNLVASDLDELKAVSFRFNYLNPINLQHILLPTLAAIACLAVVYLYQTAARAKIIYFSARQLDGREVSSAQLGQVALSTLWRLVRLDVVIATLVSLLICSLVATNYYLNLLFPGTNQLHPLIITLVGILFVYLLVGIVLSRTFGSRSVILGLQKPISAVIWGWKLFWHNSSDVIIWGTESLALTSLITSPLILIQNGTSHIEPNISWLVEFLLVSTICGYFFSVFNLGFWSSIYYDLSLKIEPQQRQQLLASSIKLKSTNTPLTWALITVMIIEIIAYVGWKNQGQLAQWLLPVIRSL